MITSLKRAASFYTNSFNDFSTKRKLVVFESDDWGSIRMPSKTVYSTLKLKGFDLSSRPFERFDSIATNDDLTMLFELLTSFRDFKNNHPVITANIITGNPDFQKIKQSNYQEFYVEEFTETLKNYETDFSLWKEGIQNKVLFPQFHGREHLLVSKWMKSLQEKEQNTVEAFNVGMMGIPPKSDPSIGNKYQIAFDLDTTLEQNKLFVKNSIKTGVEIFEKHFYTKPLSFISPVYTWDEFIEKTLRENNIKYLQGGRFQILPNNSGRIKHNIGEKKNGLIYNVRNAYFEPSTNLNFNKREDDLGKLKYQTRLAFRFNKPLTVSMHRLNFVGRLDVNNRDINLGLLRNYLSWLIKTYPEVEFLNTIELMKIIENENSHT